MTVFLRWWMSAPIEFKYAAIGVVSPHVLLGLTYWLAH